MTVKESSFAFQWFVDTSPCVCANRDHLISTMAKRVQGKTCTPRNALRIRIEKNGFVLNRILHKHLIKSFNMSFNMNTYSCKNIRGKTATVTITVTGFILFFA